MCKQKSEMNRRKFIKQTLAAGAALSIATKLKAASYTDTVNPVIITTWNSGLKSNPVGWKVLADGGRALDACEAGVKIVEADPTDTSVGIGGFPDRDGHVTLDACVMDEFGNCGSVVFIEDILHPVSVARLVMEKTPHVFLAGSGAQQFALENGFKKENLLTDNARNAWLKWKEEKNYIPSEHAPNHDTIGMIALDKKGNLSGACSTSGWAFKVRGRFGDSPVIGAGLYVDNEYGAATATGLGEVMIKICGTHLICEFMRMGQSPQQACQNAVKRVYDKFPNYRKDQICFIALGKDGRHGAYSMTKGFQYTITKEGESVVIDSDYLVR